MTMTPTPERDADGMTGIELEFSLNKKRTGEDIAEYPRRRATIACQICRLRKTRCNGARPKCQLCSDLDAECIYREPGVKLDAGDKLILEQLTRIEGLLQSSLSVQTHPHQLTLSSASPATSNDTGMGIEDPFSRISGFMSTTSKMAAVGLGSWANPPPSISISTMPKVHSTPALHLLQWPLIRDLVSRPYDPQNLLQLEMAREPLRLNPNSGFDLGNAPVYVRAFFGHANIWYACVNPYNWDRYYRTALAQRFRDGPVSCLVLLVLALGAASRHGSIASLPRDREPPGLPYFAAAWAILPSIMMRNSVIAAQCMILASAYLFYLVRPLEAWTILSSVSLKLQLLLGNPDRVPAQWKELSIRVYWNALLFESDLLAELDLPHSGIVNFEELVDLPGGFDEYEDEEESFPEYQRHAFEDSQPRDHIQRSRSTGLDSKKNKQDSHNNSIPPEQSQPDRESGKGLGTHQDEIWYFLAEIALRRLLNRVSHLIYQKDSTHTLASLGPIVSELDFQLAQWYESLPQPIQFPLNPTTTTTTTTPTTTTTTTTTTIITTPSRQPPSLSSSTSPSTASSSQTQSNAPPQPPINPIQTVLRLRYNACRTIIYRPYVLAVLEHESAGSDPGVLECCRRCLDATLRQLENITSHREGHLPYLWQGALSMVSQALIIMGATMSPTLSTLLPAKGRIDAIIAGVVDEVQRYAHLAPSLKLAEEIIRDAERRRRILLRS
ncbi:hypothetical protein N7539_005332 [Penicillium diatomitis]|uniref:Zn(2)-C6 fungal-type domain-containing protein n=1 Tax=Penicillium diatomitis TaxID=2819901 RepID=A0A9W9X728_9EURO|nr:uncharacterized protein N7539_005332 [Penicillium diatomitis]KAJ5485344.1 hypothetical protein N7539_005332 [Penicillium diatomitis]